MKNIIQQYRFNADHYYNNTYAPNWTPILHTRGRCDCERVETFKTTPHQKYPEDRESKNHQDPYTNSNKKVNLDVNVHPNSEIDIIPACTMNITSTSDGKTMGVSTGTGGTLITAPGSAVYSGGFLSLFTDAAKNVFYCTKDTTVTAVSVYAASLGGPGNAWSAVSITINEATQSQSPCEIGTGCYDIPGTTPFGSVGHNGTSIPSTDPQWVTLPMLHNGVVGAQLKEGRVYVFAHYMGVGAQTGWLGQGHTDPPWGFFIKSMRGFILSGEENVGPPVWGGVQDNRPDCNNGIAMIIYTTEDCVAGTQTIVTPLDVYAGVVRGQTGSVMYVPM